METGVGGGRVVSETEAGGGGGGTDGGGAVRMERTLGMTLQREGETVIKIWGYSYPPTHLSNLLPNEL